MSHFIPGSLGEFTGKTGEVVTCRWRKLKIGRSVPSKTKKKTTFPVKNQRSKIGIMSSFLKIMKTAVDMGFPSRGMHSAMNSAMKYNVKNALSGTFPDLKIDYPKIRLSSGWLDQVYTPVMSVTKGSQIQINWLNPPNLKPGVEETDTVQLYFFIEAKVEIRKPVKSFVNIAFRADGGVTVNLGKSLNGTIHCWMFLIAADGKGASNSKYLGQLIPGAGSG